MRGHIRSILRERVLDALSAPVPELTRRDVHVPQLEGKAVAVIGPRRAGKTSLLWQLLRQRLEAGAPRDALLLFGFEDDRLAGMELRDLDVLLESYFELHPEFRARQRVTLFLDEIQLVPGWERFVRRLLDTEVADVFVSGSSAQMLSREIATSMRGRALEAIVLPFSFREYVRHSGREPADASRPTAPLRSMLRGALAEYLTVGGYPEAQGLATRDREALLRSYVDVALLRDVIERHGVTQPAALRWMTRQLLGNAAGTFSVNRFHRDLASQGLAIGKDTLHDLLRHLTDAFVIRLAEVETASERRRMVNPRKCYPVDPGLIPLFDRTGRANTGHALETCVLLELLRRGAEVTYVKTAGGREVDFLARLPGGEHLLVQVSDSIADPRTLDRETRALVEASAEHPEARLLLITRTPDRADDVPPDIEVHDAAMWLLG
jgi:predicted AAA+ superfamily ATPase